MGASFLQPIHERVDKTKLVVKWSFTDHCGFHLFPALDKNHKLHYRYFHPKCDNWASVHIFESENW